MIEKRLALRRRTTTNQPNIKQADNAVSKTPISQGKANEYASANPQKLLSHCQERVYRPHAMALAANRPFCW